MLVVLKEGQVHKKHMYFPSSNLFVFASFAFFTDNTSSSVFICVHLWTTHFPYNNQKVGQIPLNRNRGLDVWVGFVADQFEVLVFEIEYRFRFRIDLNHRQWVRVSGQLLISLFEVVGV